MINKTGKKLPEIIIKYNRLLDPIFLTYVEHHPEWKEVYSKDKWSPWPKDALLKNIEECKKEWKKYEKQILEGMCDVLGIDFYRNVINVHIVSANPRSFSNPIVVRGTFAPLRFVESLTHELVHELCTYGVDRELNNALYFKILRKIFPGNWTSSTINHTLIYAVLEYLFKDILNNVELWKISEEKAHKHEDYKEAIRMSKEKGHKNLIKEFKEKFEEYKK